jgi:hypothetical protein
MYCFLMAVKSSIQYSFAQTSLDDVRKGLAERVVRLRRGFEQPSVRQVRENLSDGPHPFVTVQWMFGGQFR